MLIRAYFGVWTMRFPTDLASSHTLVLQFGTIWSCINIISDVYAKFEYLNEIEDGTFVFLENAGSFGWYFVKEKKMSFPTLLVCCIHNKKKISQHIALSRFLNVNGFILSVGRFVVPAHMFYVKTAIGNVSRCRWQQLSSGWAGRITITGASGWNGRAATYWTIFNMSVKRHCVFIYSAINIVLLMHLPGNELKFSLIAANDDGIAVKLSFDFPMSAAFFCKRECWTSVEIRMCA